MLEFPLSQLRDHYAAELRLDGKSEGTRKKWLREVDVFVTWAGETPLHEIQRREIKGGFLNGLEADFRARHGRDMSPATLRNAIQALKSFYNFLDVNDYLEGPEGIFRNPMNKIRPPQVPHKPISWLQQEEDRRLMRDGPKKGRSSNALRDRTVLSLYRYTGVRLDEGLSLTMRSVNVAGEEPTVRVLRSKTESGLLREIPIVPELLPVLVRWIEYTKQKGIYSEDGPFLVTRNGTEMFPQQVNTMIHRMAERAGLESNVTPQTLRRTFGSDLINRGLRLEVVSKLLGHSSTSVTERAYAVLLNDTIRREMMTVLLAA